MSDEKREIFEKSTQLVLRKLDFEARPKKRGRENLLKSSKSKNVDSSAVLPVQDTVHYQPEHAVIAALVISVLVGIGAVLALAIAGPGVALVVPFLAKAVAGSLASTGFAAFASIGSWLVGAASWLSTFFMSTLATSAVGGLFQGLIAFGVGVVSSMAVIGAVSGLWAVFTGLWNLVGKAGRWLVQGEKNSSEKLEEIDNKRADPLPKIIECIKVDEDRLVFDKKIEALKLKYKSEALKLKDKSEELFLSSESKNFESLDASLEEILRDLGKDYRSLARIYHPDKFRKIVGRDFFCELTKSVEKIKKQCTFARYGMTSDAESEVCKNVYDLKIKLKKNEESIFANKKSVSFLEKAISENEGSISGVDASICELKELVREMKASIRKTEKRLLVDKKLKNQKSEELTSETDSLFGGSSFH